MNTELFGARPDFGVGLGGHRLHLSNEFSDPGDLRLQVGLNLGVQFREPIGPERPELLDMGVPTCRWPARVDCSSDYLPWPRRQPYGVLVRGHWTVNPCTTRWKGPRSRPVGAILVKPPPPSAYLRPADNAAPSVHAGFGDRSGGRAELESFT